MPGDCPNWWQTYGCEWSLGYLWHRMSWLTHLDVFVLALMLAYVVIVVSRGSYRYHLARRQYHTFVRDTTAALGKTTTRNDAGDTPSWSFEHSQRAIAVNLRLRAETLRSIAYAAPYVGLAGTCCGILSAFRGVGMQRQAALAMITTYIAASLITTAAGLLAVVPAVCSYNYLCVCIERLEAKTDSVLDGLASRRADGPIGAGARLTGKFPLTRQFSRLPAFGLVAAPILALSLAGYTTFASFHSSVGLAVRVVKPIAPVMSDDSQINRILVGIRAGTSGQTVVYVNSKETPWEGLDGAVRKQLKMHPQFSVCVEAGNEVTWAEVAKLIDAMNAIPTDVVLLTIAASPKEWSQSLP